MNVKTAVKYKILLLVIIFLGGFLVRFYRFDNPIADWHSWRQADTSAVSRNFVATGFDVLHPTFDDLSNVPSGLDNPNGYRFVEFPIYNVLQAASFKFFGVITLEQWGRLITIIASLFSSIFLFLLIKKRFGEFAGALAAFFFLFLPFNIYYSRTILPDPLMVTMVLGSTYFFDAWLAKSKGFKIYNLNFMLSLIFLILALLLKPYALFFTLPMLYLSFEKFGIAFLKKWQLLVLLIVSLIPLGLWRLWILNFPQGIPAFTWLLNGNHIRFRPSFFYWIFYQRLISLILGFFGTIIFIFAFLAKYKHKDLFFLLSFCLSSLVYVTVLASGNVQHDYYQILVIPSVSIVLSLGCLKIINTFEKYHKFAGVGLVLVLVSLSFYFAWGQVKDYFNINNRSIVVAGEAVDKLTPKNAKVIANYTGDTSFLYQTKRKGWASFEKPLPVMINNLGADFLVLANPTAVDLGLGKTYKIIALTKEYVIFNLRVKP